MEKSDRDLLAEMLKAAEKLCRSNDALLAGQYEYLRARIEAVMELHIAADGEA
jgi:hypothetical protein